MHLPKGEQFQTWRDQTAYTRVLYVDRAHPDTSDGNPRTEQKPFRTINRVMCEAGPGTKVRVKSGVYREEVAPVRGGAAADAMVCYEAAPGAKVVLRGSRVLPPEWTRSRYPHGSDGPVWTLAGRENLDWDRWSAVLPLAMAWDGGRSELAIETGLAFPSVPHTEASGGDFWNNAVTKEWVSPGPIEERFVGQACFRLAADLSPRG